MRPKQIQSKLAEDAAKKAAEDVRKKAEEEEERKKNQMVQEFIVNEIDANTGKPMRGLKRPATDPDDPTASKREAVTATILEKLHGKQTDVEEEESSTTD